MSKVILSLCDFSGRWSQPYRDAGYEVIQVDLKHGGDVRLLENLKRPVQGILCAPVCTDFSAAGARWWKQKELDGNQGLLDGLALVDACIRIIHVHQPEWWVMENPVGRLKRWLGTYAMTFDPYEFAGWADEPNEEAYTKRTCLWGKFNPPEKSEIYPVLGSKMWAKYGGKSERTKTLRSITPQGFSRAFFKSNP